MRIKQLLAVLLLTAVSAALFTSCGPKYASEDEIIEYAKASAGKEPVELVEQVDEHRYRFRSKDRELYFEAWTTPDQIYIDGSSFGYTDKYHIICDYIDCVHRYNDERVENLLEKYGLEEAGRSYPFEYYESFTFVIPNSQVPEDIALVNGFLNDLRLIVEEEQKYHDSPLGAYSGSYNYTVLYQVDKEAFQRTIGNYNYSSYIVPGQEIDILKDLRYSDQLLANAIPPVRHGILIYVESDFWKE